MADRILSQQLHRCSLTSFYHRILVAAAFVVVSCQAIIPDDLVVQTTKGKIRGVTLKSATNK